MPNQVELTDADLTDLLDDGAPALAAAGDLRTPPARARRSAGDRVVAGDAGPGPERSADDPPTLDPFTLDREVALHGDPLTAAERAELAGSRGPVVRLRDGWCWVDSATRRRARQPSAGPVGAVDALGAALTGEIDRDGARGHPDVPRRTARLVLTT